MLATVVFLITAQSTANAVFDRAAKAIANLKAGSVLISADGTASGEPIHEKDDLVFVRPNQIRLTVTTTQTKRKAATKRTYYLRDGDFTGFDQLAQEYLKRSTDAKGSLLDRLNFTAGDLGQHITVLIDPTAFSSFIAPFRTMTGFKITQSASSVDVVRATKSSIGNATIVFSFDRKSMLPRAIKVNNPGSSAMWRYTYRGAPSRVSFSLPGGAHRVPVFTERPTPPTFADAKAKAAVDASRRAYASLRSGQATVTFGGQRSQYWIGNGRVRERGAALEWSYGNGILTAHQLRTGKFFQGRSTKSQLIDYVTALGGTMEPRLRAYVYGRSPVDQIFNGGMRVRISGTMALGGSSITILEGRSRGLNVSAAITNSTHLFSSISATVLDERGRATGRSEASLSYSLVNKTIPPASLLMRIPKGAPVNPLPAIKTDK